MTILLVLASVLLIIGIVCQIILLVAAFMDEAWKGLLGLFVGFYLWYFCVVEFDHPRKWWILGGAIAGNLLGYALARVALPATLSGGH